MLNASFVKEIRLEPPEQRRVSGHVMPLVLECAHGVKLEQVVSWIKENTSELENLVHTHGAILFRGFPLDSAESFDSFVNGFAGWQDLTYTESLSVAVRTHITGRVCTTNDGKYGGLVFHHEMAQTPLWPSKVMFFCLNPATEGGATGISSSNLAYRALQEKYPEFINKCQKLGAKYTLYLGPDQDTSKGAGRSWKSLWKASTKQEAEEAMKKFGYTWEWMEDDGLRCTTPVLKSVVVAPGTDQNVFFNQLVAQMQNAKEWKLRAKDTNESINLDKFLTFGDGSSMEIAPLEYAKQILEENAVEIKWRKNDVALLDNYLVMHARRLFEGPRQVFASLVL